MKPYKKYFKNLKTWVYGTAVSHFVIYLLAFLLLCFAFTKVEISDESQPSNEVFISKFGKYFILTTAILCLIPFLLSLILKIAVLHEHQKLLTVWIKTSIVFYPIFTLGLVAVAIFLIVEGALSIGCTTLVLAIILAAFMTHSILLVYYLTKDYIDKSGKSTSSEEEEIED